MATVKEDVGGGGNNFYIWKDLLNKKSWKEREKGVIE